MAGTNGHAHAQAPPLIDQSTLRSTAQIESKEERFSDLKVRESVAKLEIPFDTAFIGWRVTNTANDGKRGLIVPYADPRAYSDRLNALFTPAGWTRKYSVSTSANFERAKDKKVVAKILVTCELTIFGLGSHSATGEEFADSQCALTTAEAQAFKRSCACFGLGRYLYYFRGVWVDLDDRKRPTTKPILFDWATPEGWLSGLRPASAQQSEPTAPSGESAVAHHEVESVMKEIEAMAESLSRGLYRGILRDVARAWNPRDIQVPSIRHKVLEQLRAAERGVRRLEAALDQVGNDRLTPILKSLGFKSLERVDRLETLTKIIVELERLPHES